MTYIEKNKKSIIIGGVAALILIILLIFLLQKKEISSSDEIIATVTPTELSVGDTLRFEDLTPNVKERYWLFGDGSKTTKDRGYYVYKKAGLFEISLHIKNFSKRFSVMVTQKNIDVITDSIQSVIIAPAQAMQNENVIFRAENESATSFQWEFGESGFVDAKGATSSYIYQTPGIYTVRLYTENNDIPPVEHVIQILEAYDDLNDEELKVNERYKKTDSDFKYHLQQIALGNNFNHHYNYLLNTYLCGNPRTVIKANDTKIDDFFMYCANLQFEKNKIIQQAKVGFDETQTCVTIVEITQSN